MPQSVSECDRRVSAKEGWPQLVSECGDEMPELGQVGDDSRDSEEEDKVNQVVPKLTNCAREIVLREDQPQLTEKLPHLVLSDDEDKDEELPVPECEAEKWEIVTRVAEIGTRAIFEHFTYKFDGKIYRQKDGSPIGARASMAASRLVMQDWRLLKWKSCSWPAILMISEIGVHV